MRWLQYICPLFERWLTPHRQKFVGAWIDKVMHLGNQTTNRYD